MPSLVTLSLPLTALYSGAVGMLFALLSLRAAFYRGSKGRKYYYGDHNTPKAPRLQGIVHVSAALPGSSSDLCCKKQTASNT